MDAIAARIDTIKGGSRHEHMLALCRVLLDRGVSIVDAEDILTATWERYGGELAERAPSEIPNALATTQARIENDAPAKGVPYLEEATPELFEELRTVFGWVEKIIGATDEERREQAARAWETCEDLAKRRDITGDLVDVLRRRGVAGESKLIRLVYLALNSCRLDKMVNVALKGPSSSGKSYIAEKILEMFPESAFYALTSMSKRRSST